MTTADATQLEQLDARIRAVWTREQTLHLLGGLLTLCRWAVPLFIACMLIDWLAYVPAPGRVVMLLTLVGVSAHRAWVGGWRRLRPFDAVRTALRLESQLGDLESLLVSAIQLRNDTRLRGASRSLRDHTCRLAEQAAATLRPDEAVSYRPLRHPGLFAVLAVGVIAVFALINAPFLGAGLTRIFTPWIAVEYPTNTRITLAEDELVIKEGDSAVIEALIGGVVPERAKIDVQTGKGRARAIERPVTEGRCEYTIDSASRDFSYRFRAGDDRTGWRRVRVVPSPRLEAVEVELTYPEYLQRATDSVEALTLTVPEGTGVAWRLTLDRPISAAQLLRDGQPAADLNVSGDGRIVTFTQDVLASQGYSFLWVGKENGFRFTSPRYYLQVASDQAPRVELVSPSRNMAATLGRPLRLAVRAQDDHAIGSTTVLYRVNQHEDKTHRLEEPVQSGQAAQAIDWDYRTALTDLAVGDSVSFAVRVSDRYPGEHGPHTVRTETRRLTFLSRAKYLEQIEKQKDRLLSRVQTIYRQQRSAHVAVLNLAAEDEGYAQACQVEAIRQEMMRDQLKEVAGQMQALLDDLVANNVAEAAEAESLVAVRAAVLDIADSRIARAADLLRAESGGAIASGPLSSAGAADAVNAAARDLASLVLLRGIDSAQEVYAREARMLARAQAALRWQTASNTSDDARTATAERQDELAQWTDRLTRELQAGMRYDKRPLAVLRLIRGIKDLRNAGASTAMRDAASLIRQGNRAKAAAVQADLVRALLNAEFGVRRSGAYSTVLRTRDQMRMLTRSQQALRAQTDSLSAENLRVKGPALAAQQTALRRQLLTLMLPSIPAPRARLFDPTLPQAPPVERLLSEADLAMAAVLSALADGDAPAATAQQQAAAESLAALTEIIDTWSVEMGLRAQGLGTVVAASSERLSRVDGLEAQVIALLEKTDIAAAGETKTADLADTQFLISEELAGFHEELAREHEANPDPDLPPLLGPLKLAERAMNAGVQSLKDNRADDAIGYQERAADALAQAHAVVLAQNERLGMLQGLLLFQRSVGFANAYMADIVAEQRDLLKATGDIRPADLPPLLPVFNNLRQCMADVAPLLDLVGARLDVGTPLAFAQADFEDAVASLQAGDNVDAADAQDVAAESLAEVQSRVADIRAQTGYVAEIVAFMHTATSDAALMRHQQAELMDGAAAAGAGRLHAVTKEQAELLKRAERFDRLIEAAAGNPKVVVPPEPTALVVEPAVPTPMFAKVAGPMRAALMHLNAGDADAAAAPMQLATNALSQNAESLATMIEMLYGLPSVEITTQTKPELVRLADVLALASDQRLLSRTTRAGGAAALAGPSDPQQELASRCGELAQAVEPHPILEAAHERLTDAVAALASADRDALVTSQQAADTQLRHFIVEQAVILKTAIPPPAPADADAADGPGSDAESAVTAGFIADFVSGEAPNDKRSEWKVRGERNRAALNQNFARELPLEYRGLLKSYYERVAQ